MDAIKYDRGAIKYDKGGIKYGFPVLVWFYPKPSETEQKRNHERKDQQKYVTNVIMMEVSTLKQDQGDFGELQPTN